MLIAKQAGLSGFAYDFFDVANKKIGSLRFSDMAVATNARLKDHVPAFLNQNIEIIYDNQSFQVEFEYLTRDWANDIEFKLKLDAETLAVARDLQAKKLGAKRPEIQIELPFEAMLVHKSSFPKVRFDLELNGAKLGSISEQGFFSWTRRLTLELPDSVPIPIQIFWFFLVCNRSFR
jgi:hypothetical protein